MVRAWPLLLLLGACVDPPCEGDMLASPGGLVVTYVEHPTGWGNDDCAACHVPDVTHTRGCTEGVDLEAIRRRVDEEGVESCTSCHGLNGGTP